MHSRWWSWWRREGCSWRTDEGRQDFHCRDSLHTRAWRPLPSGCYGGHHSGLLRLLTVIMFRHFRLDIWTSISPLTRTSTLLQGSRPIYENALIFKHDVYSWIFNLGLLFYMLFTHLFQGRRRSVELSSSFTAAGDEFRVNMKSYLTP